MNIPLIPVTVRSDIEAMAKVPVPTHPPDRGPQWWREMPSWMRALTVLVSLVVVASLLRGIGGGKDDGSPDESSSPSTSKYDQTWTTSYGSTSCGQWSNAMTTQQRFAAAADMLSGARNKGDGGTGLPSDALILRFEGDVTEACSAFTGGQSWNIAEIGASVYLVGRDQYRP